MIKRKKFLKDTVSNTCLYVGSSGGAQIKSCDASDSSQLFELVSSVWSLKLKNK